MIMQSMIKKLLSFLLIITLVFTVLPPIYADASAYGIPTPVGNRILTAYAAGDSSDWIEIAQYGNHSLILRKDALQASGFGSTSQYSKSTARNIVNNWFNYTLSSGARLRDFSAKNNAMTQLGYWTVTSSGFSLPTGYARTGDDVAFLLSFAEAAYFCSTQYASSSTNYTRSSYIADSNFTKLTHITGGQPLNHWWLRTPGGLSDRVCTVGLGGFNIWGSVPMNGAVNQYQISSNVIKIRPALWADSGIFQSNYQVTYNPNGGLGSINAINVAANSYHTVTNQGYTRNGFTFTGWNTRPDGLGVNYTNGQLIYVTGNITLYAQWIVTPNINYFVTYYPNGGSGTTNNYSVAANSYYTIASQGYTLGGYEFDGWNTRPDGYGVNYVNGQQIYITGSVSLYAKWRYVPPTTHYVTYNPNGGIGQITAFAFADNTYHTVANLGYSLPGYSFAGYNTMANGSGTQYSAGQGFYVKSSLTLYAQWAPITYYFVIYDPNGGTGQLSYDMTDENRQITIVDKGFTRGVYTFIGWNTMPNGSGIPYAVGQRVTLNTSIILYAQWQLVD